MGMRKRKKLSKIMITEIEISHVLLLSISDFSINHAAALKKLCENGGDSWGITVRQNSGNYIIL